MRPSKNDVSATPRPHLNGLSRALAALGLFRPMDHTHQTVALDVIRRPKTTLHELECYLRCSEVQRCPCKRNRLGALRTTKISADSRVRRSGQENDNGDRKPCAPSNLHARAVVSPIMGWGTQWRQRTMQSGMY